MLLLAPHCNAWVYPAIPIPKRPKTRSADLGECGARDRVARWTCGVIESAWTSVLATKGRAVFRPIGNAVSVLVVLLVLAGCAGAEPATSSAPTSTLPTPSGLSGPYVGQQPPGTTPKIFAPGVRL